jgi:IclR family pca regulon transcriptional regulator
MSSRSERSAGQRKATARDPGTAAAQLAQYAGDPDFMASLARGLAVLSTFSEHPKGMSGSQISQRTALSRASVRRCLATLAKLGYASQDGQLFRLTPKVLNLSQAYLSSESLATVAQPHLNRLRDQIHESCSLGVMEGDEVLYLARAETQRIISISLRVGSRLPAYCTSMGRILLADLPPAALDAYLARTALVGRTWRTVTTVKQLREKLAAVRRLGYSRTDQELELGLRSIAVPVNVPGQGVVAALNIGAPAARVSASDLIGRALPRLQTAARQIVAEIR